MKRTILALLLAVLALAGSGRALADSGTERAAYLGQMMAYSSMYGITTDRIQTAINAGDPIAIEKEVNTFRVLDAGVQQVSPPAEFAPSHAEVVAAFDAAAQSADLIDAGITNNDPASINAATEAMSESAAHLNQAKALLGPLLNQ